MTVALQENGATVLFLKGPDSALWVKSEASQVTRPGAPRSESSEKKWGEWTRLGGQLTSHPTVASNADGSLEVLFRGVDNGLHRTVQVTPNGAEFGPVEAVGDGSFKLSAHPVVATQKDSRLLVLGYSVLDGSLHVLQQATSANGTKSDSTWGANPTWTSIGGKWRGIPAAAASQDGLLTVFARSQHGSLYAARQTVANGAKFDHWIKVKGQMLGDPVVGAGADGRINVFARFIDNAVWTVIQSAVNSEDFGAWTSLGGSVTADPAVVKRDDGTLELFVRWDDNKAYHKWQTAVGTWTKWFALDGSLTSHPSVVLRRSLVELYGVGSDNSVVFKKQNMHIDWKWSGWTDHNGRLTGDPTVAYFDGRAIGFIRGANNALFVSHQKSLTNTELWTSWVNLGGQLNSDPVVVHDAEGLFHVFVLGFDNALWHTQQVEAGDFDKWTKVSRVGGHLIGTPAVVLNKAGRFEVFARSIDNSLVQLVELTEEQVAIVDRAQAKAEKRAAAGGAETMLEVAPAKVGEEKENEKPAAKTDALSKQVETEDEDESIAAPAKINWSAWSNVGGETATVEESPLASVDKWGRINIFFRGALNSVRYLVETDSSARLDRSKQFASGLQLLSGMTVAHKPSVTADHNGLLQVYAVDMSGKVHRSVQESKTAWSAWQPVGIGAEQAITAPTVAWDKHGRPMVLIKGPDSHVYGCSEVGGKAVWSKWYRIDGQAIEGEPRVVSYNNGVIMILGRGTSNVLWGKQFGLYITDSSADWAPWTSLGGRLG